MIATSRNHREPQNDNHNDDDWRDVRNATTATLAIVIGALAAYIWYCQSHGGKWPGLGVPTAKNGYYSLRCVK